MKVFYHNDHDGQCSAALLYGHYSLAKQDLYEVGYYRPFPFDVIEKDEKVIIVDWSLNEEKDGWSKLFNITKNVVWIDHHKSAVKNCPKECHDLEGIRDLSYAACQLVVKYLNITEPKFVSLVADYDIWKFEYGDSTLGFHYGLLLYDTSPDQQIWKDLLSLYAISRVIGSGQYIQQYIDKNNDNIYALCGYETTIEGYKAVACNYTRAGAKLFDRVDNKPALTIIYYHNGEDFHVSLYSSDKTIKCNEIAERFGGGGHPGAAGFRCKELPFKKIK